MPQPKRRHSHSRKNKRRAHDFLTIEGLSLCPHCREPKLPHRVCPHCGYYGDKQITKGKEE